MDQNVELVRSKQGMYLAFGSDFDIVESLKQTGFHDAHVVKIGLSLLNDRKDFDTVIDVGAHLGTFSIPLCKVKPCKVVAFEAQRHISQLLGANFLLNGLYDAWVHNIIVGASDDLPPKKIPLVDFSVAGNFGAFSVDEDIAKDRSAKRMNFLDSVDTVQVRSLDSYGFKKVGLIKIDVEGQELNVLRGAVQTMKDSGYPPVIFECWEEEPYADLRTETIQFMTDLGYTYELRGENIIAIYPQG